MSSQNIYDDPSFFEAYSELPRSTCGLARALEWPVLKSLLPPLKDTRVVDLGCGYGYFCHWAAEQGAKSVLAVDISDLMLAKAKELRQSELAKGTTGEEVDIVQFQRQDLQTLELPPGAFDVAFSSLAFHYVRDLKPLFQTIYQALVPGAKMVFSIEHPIFSASKQPGWVIKEGGHRTWGVDNYMMEGERVANWLGEDVVKYHRTTGTLLNCLIEVGWRLVCVKDFGPSEEEVESGLVKAGHRERPVFLLVCAVKG